MLSLAKAEAPAENCDSLFLWCDEGSQFFRKCNCRAFAMGSRRVSTRHPKMKNEWEKHFNQFSFVLGECFSTFPSSLMPTFDNSLCFPIFLPRSKATEALRWDLPFAKQRKKSLDLSLRRADKLSLDSLLIHSSFAEIKLNFCITKRIWHAKRTLSNFPKTNRLSNSLSLLNVKA